ncbi:hypothetical protein Pelo_17266 [Pelomyxa schiedti]|nr:hypothetical protein Pelo_17266 [Pelomyxa schiedti]
MDAVLEAWVPRGTIGGTSAKGGMAPTSVHMTPSSPELSSQIIPSSRSQLMIFHQRQETLLYIRPQSRVTPILHWKLRPSVRIRTFSAGVTQSDSVFSLKSYIVETHLLLLDIKKQVHLVPQGLSQLR